MEDVGESREGEGMAMKYTDEEAIAELRRRFAEQDYRGRTELNDDPENSHSEADDIMLELLEETHPKFVALFREMDRWYS